MANSGENTSSEILAAKASHEKVEESAGFPDLTKEENPTIDMDLVRRSDDLEEVIRAAEEAAYSGMENK